MKLYSIIKIWGVFLLVLASPLSFATENHNEITVGVNIPKERNDFKSELALAHQGHAGAQNNVGMAYLLGAEVPQNITQGLAWLEKSAKQGDDTALANLGGIYLYGMGDIAPDYAKAKTFLEQAISKDNLFAYSHLGLMYANGLGMQPDYAKAKALWEYAAQKGSRSAQNNLAYLIYWLGNGTQPDYQKARFWLEKSAAQNYSVAQRNLGVLYAQGLGTKPDKIKAQKYLQQAAEQGDVVAQHLLKTLSE